MYTRIDRWHLACFSDYPAQHADACLRVLARDKELRWAVASNPALGSSLWFELWSERLPVDLASLMVSRQLSAEQRSTVLSKESRVKVLSAMVDYNVLSTAEQQQLLARKPALAEALLRQPWMSRDLRSSAATTAGGLSLLEELAYDAHQLFTDEYASRLMEDYDLWAPQGRFRERSELLRVLLHRRPCLVEVAISSKDDTLVTSAAGSWNLTLEQSWKLLDTCRESDDPSSFRGNMSYALLALVNNPVVHLDVVEAVANSTPGSDMALSNVVSSAKRRLGKAAIECSIEEIQDELSLAWMIRRSLPSEYSPGRPVELALLALNPHLVSSDKDKVTQALRGSRQSFVDCFPGLSEVLGGDYAAAPRDLSAPTRRLEPYVLHSDVQSVCADLVARSSASPAAWEVLVSLLDEFEGSPMELCALAESL